MNTNLNQTSRRDFVKTASVSAGLIGLSAKTALTADANSALQLGVIGCGGRGTSDANNFIRSTNTRVVAIADFFEDRLDAFQDNIGKRQIDLGGKKIEDSRKYKGIMAHKELLQSDVDMILITSPPYFHPTHLEATVEAGKHVYMEKPVGVDVAGAKKVLEVGKKAQGKLSLMVGHQIRFSPQFQGVAERIHKGDIGEAVSGQAYFHTGRLGAKSTPGASAQENRLRNWVFDIELSGDIIVEQNVHVLDICNWYLQDHPVKAFGTGGRKGRVDVGDCYDHFIVTYWYPNDVHLDFASSQFLRGWSDTRERIFGTKGVADSPYSGNPQIMGDNKWVSDSDSPLSGTDAMKMKALEDSIRSGNFVNEAETATMSTLTGVLGRIAAYEERIVTWDEMMDSNLKYDAGLDL